MGIFGRFSNPKRLGLAPMGVSCLPMSCRRSRGSMEWSIQKDVNKYSRLAMTSLPPTQTCHSTYFNSIRSWADPTLEHLFWYSRLCHRKGRIVARWDLSKLIVAWNDMLKCWISFTSILLHNWHVLFIFPLPTWVCSLVACLPRLTLVQHSSSQL